VVFNGKSAVIGGVEWDINVQKSAVEFINGRQRILLLFDRSLSAGGSSPSTSRTVAAPESIVATPAATATSTSTTTGAAN